MPCGRVDSFYPKLNPVHPLVQQWRRWHQRAECAFEIASEFGWVNRISKAERSKCFFPPPDHVSRVPAIGHHKQFCIVICSECTEH